MYLFASDETNKNPVPGTFFIYGGVVLTQQQAAVLSARVAEIRLKYGYLPGDSFKFAVRQTPKHVSAARAKLAKAEVVRVLEGIGARMIVYVVLHDIGINKSDRERMEMALNVVALRYHDLLRRESEVGTMQIDRADEHHGHLAYLFQHGVAAQGWAVPLADRILSFNMTSDNASHVSSAADIALGAFRYCVNTAGGQGREEVAKEMFPPIARMIWGVKEGSRFVLDGHGYNPYPREIRSPAFRAKCDDLADALVTFGGGDGPSGQRVAA